MTGKWTPVVVIEDCEALQMPEIYFFEGDQLWARPSAISDDVYEIKILHDHLDVVPVRRQFFAPGHVSRSREELAALQEAEKRKVAMKERQGVRLQNMSKQDLPHTPLEDVSVFIVHYAGRELSFMNVDVLAPASALVALVEERLGICHDDGGELFRLWVCGADVEVELHDHECAFEVMHDWSQYLARYSEYYEGMLDEDGHTPPRLVYRTTALLTKAYERRYGRLDREHRRVVELLHAQAIHNMWQYIYCEATFEDLVNIIACSLQGLEGAYDPARHSKDNISLKDLVPPYYLNKLGSRTAWAEKISERHKELLNTNRLVALLLVLQQVRQWSAHNGTVFVAQYQSTSRQKMKKHPYEKGVRVVVNAANLCCMHVDKPKNLEAIPLERLDDFFFKDDLFTAKMSDGTVHTFITKKGRHIAELLHAALIAAEREEAIRSQVTMEQARGLDSQSSMFG